jgi:hypothetical protein
MEEVLVIFETAKLAKEKGFNAGCDGRWYIEPGSDWKYSKQGLFKCDNTGDSIARPTQSLLQKWLREVHRTDITVITDWKQGVRVYYVGFSFVNTENKIDIWFSKDENNNKIEYSDYEEALEIGLQEALKLIK